MNLASELFFYVLRRQKLSGRQVKDATAVLSQVMQVVLVHADASCAETKRVFLTVEWNREQSSQIKSTSKCFRTTEDL
ncbi:hypothetical protein L596_015358 [Steinernema carpocapsae]|uniref:Uncharacterized protein n=1 Tax=Steinernema carpocapsae TaxID=34508 RepID=A0A4U5NFM2_STECR|nr:hypothetical protein L596_015358 [Steinernema carpocapsae]